MVAGRLLIVTVFQYYLLTPLTQIRRIQVVAMFRLPKSYVRAGGIALGPTGLTGNSTVPSTFSYFQLAGFHEVANEKVWLKF